MFYNKCWGSIEKNAYGRPLITTSLSWNHVNKMSCGVYTNFLLSQTPILHIISCFWGLGMHFFDIDHVQQFFPNFSFIFLPKRGLYIQKSCIDPNIRCRTNMRKGDRFLYLLNKALTLMLTSNLQSLLQNEAPMDVNLRQILWRSCEFRM